ncbi:MAG TPA: DMT family transporter [Actinomycetes bacterium]|nr:DMT family transporter [Actinomycetes bacterium]
MAVALVAVSTSGPLIAATTAPAMAIAFWRNGLATLVIAPYAFLRRAPRAEILSLSRREVRLALLAGLVLALHFATWVPSLRYTSVASSTALVATQPVWAALIARAFGHRVPRRAWFGIGVALAGVVVLTGVDVAVSGRALVGDVLALLGAVFAAAYVFTGAAVRATVSTTTYTLLCYGSAAVLLLGVCLVGGVALSGYSSEDWARIVALVLGAQLLGHSLFNVVLRTTSPVVVSLAILFEMPGATLIAALTLGQVPPPAILPAAALLLVGVGLVVTSQRDLPAIPAE